MMTAALEGQPWPVLSGLKMVLNLDGALGRSGTGDHRLEGALQVQPRQTSGATVAHDDAGACVAGTAASAADDEGARPAADGAGEGSGVMGLECAVCVEDRDALRDADTVQCAGNRLDLGSSDDRVAGGVLDANDGAVSGEEGGPRHRGRGVALPGTRSTGATSTSAANAMFLSFINFTIRSFR